MALFTSIPTVWLPLHHHDICVAVWADWICKTNFVTFAGCVHHKINREGCTCIYHTFSLLCQLHLEKFSLHSTLRRIHFSVRDLWWKCHSLPHWMVPAINASWSPTGYCTPCRTCSCCPSGEQFHTSETQVGVTLRDGQVAWALLGVALHFTAAAGKAVLTFWTTLTKLHNNSVLSC